MKKFLKIFLWIGLFPFMLTYWGFKTKKKPVMIIGAVLSVIFLIAVAIDGPTDSTVSSTEPPAKEIEVDQTKDNTVSESKNTESDTTVQETTDSTDTATSVVNTSEKSSTETVNSTQSFEGYTLLVVDGGDLSGHREPNAVVDIGFGNREYWAFTNEYAQLVKVTATEITLQDDKTEPVLSTGRYYSDEAKVPGTESADLDEGHVIADSLGGVSNAYNITPQDSTLNRHGDQAYMEDTIRKALQAGKKVTDFEAIITYTDSKTQIPSHYKFTYKIDGDLIIDEFDNVNPDKVNATLPSTTESVKTETTTVTEPTTSPVVVTPPASSNGLTEADIAKIDTNNNGIVTIAEAKAAGFKMPITSDHWLYKYMKDADGDGMVGENN